MEDELTSMCYYVQELAFQLGLSSSRIIKGSIYIFRGCNRRHRGDKRKIGRIKPMIAEKVGRCHYEYSKYFFFLAMDQLESLLLGVMVLSDP